MASMPPDLEALCVEFQQTGSEAARNRIIEFMMPWIERIAGRMASKLPSCIDSEDLAQAGVFGLIQAIKSYDASRGAKLPSFASHRVVGEMHDFIRAVDPYSRVARQRQKMVSTAIDEYRTMHGHAPGDDELCSHMRLQPSEFARVYTSQPKKFEHLSRRLYRDNTDTIADLIVDGRVLPMGTKAEAHDIVELVGRICGKRDADMLRLYFFEGWTFKRIAADHFGISESGVSQQFKRIRDRISAHFRGQERRRAA